MQKSVTFEVIDASAESRADARSARRVKRIIYIKKYMTKVSSPIPLAQMNNRAVDYAMNGRFIESENLLADAAAEYPQSGALYNNLAVINEIFGRRKEASDFYLRAAALDPECARFRENYLSFDDFGGR